MKSSHTHDSERKRNMYSNNFTSENDMITLLYENKYSQGILAYFCLVSFLHATIKNWCFCLNSPSLILGKREKT